MPLKPGATKLEVLEQLQDALLDADQALEPTRELWKVARTRAPAYTSATDTVSSAQGILRSAARTLDGSIGELRRDERRKKA